MKRDSPGLVTITYPNDCALLHLLGRFFHWHIATLRRLSHWFSRIATALALSSPDAPNVHATTPNPLVSPRHCLPPRRLTRMTRNDRFPALRETCFLVHSIFPQLTGVHFAGRAPRAIVPGEMPTVASDADGPCMKTKTLETPRRTMCALSSDHLKRDAKQPSFTKEKNVRGTPLVNYSSRQNA